MLRLINVLREHILLLIFFTLLTFAFTYPLVIYLTTAVHGDSDAYWFLWNLWHFKKAVNEGSNPFFSDMIFYQTGASLYLSTLTPLLSFISIPLQEYFGLFAAYNILYLLSYIFSGYFMYLLAKHITKDWQAALLAGVIFAFCPYHSAHAIRHLNLMSTQFIPLFFLLYLRFKENQTIKNAVFASLSLAIVVYSELIYFVLCLLYIIFDVLHNVSINYKKLKIELRNIDYTKYCVLLFAFVILTAPYLLGVVEDALFTKYVKFTDLTAIISFSPDLLSFFVPSQFNPLFAQFLQWIYPVLQHQVFIMDVEGTVYIGITVLLLALYAVFKIKSREVTYWRNLLLASFILTLGAALWVGGNAIVMLPPFLFLYYFFPFFSFFRVPARFDIIVMLSVSILVAFAFIEIRKKIDNKNIATVLFPAFICFLILLEFYAPPQKFIFMDNASQFYNGISADKEDYAIMNIPDYSESSNTFNIYLQYVQTIHNKKIIGGQLARTPTNAIEYLEKPCLKQLLKMKELENCSLQEYKDVIPPNVKYIIVHKTFYSTGITWNLEQRKVIEAEYKYSDKNDISMILPLLENAVGKPVFVDDDIIVYKTS